MNIISEKWRENYATFIHFLLCVHAQFGIWYILFDMVFLSLARIYFITIAIEVLQKLYLAQHLLSLSKSLSFLWRICSYMWTYPKKILFTIKTCFIQDPHLPSKTFYYVVLISKHVNELVNSIQNIFHHLWLHGI